MRIDRRTLLLTAAPSLLLPSLPFGAAAQPAALPAFLLIDDIAPEAPPDRLVAVLEPLIEAEVPLGLILRGVADPDGPVTAQDSPLPRLLQNLPDLVEPVLAVPGLAAMSPYFQRRATGDALSALSNFLEKQGVAPTSLPGPVSLATERAAGASYDAVRALGIRNILESSSDARSRSTGCAERTVCLSGSVRISLATAAPDRAIAAALATTGMVQIVVSLAGIEALPAAELRSRSDLLTREIVREVQGGRRFVVLPRTRLDWLAQTQPRYLALHIAAADGEAVADLEAELKRRGLPYSVSGAAAPPGAHRACLALDGASDAAARQWALDHRDAPQLCALGAPQPGRLSPAAEAAFDLFLVPGTWPAFDDGGRLRTGTADAASPVQGGAHQGDRVLLLDARTPASDPSLQAALDRLGSSATGPGTVLVDVPGFAGAILSADPEFDLLRATLREPAENTGATPDRERLLADAQLAWRFFLAYTDDATGLCPATVQTTADGIYRHSELTMWDYGSLIAAVMAAHELGLVSDADFVARTDLLLRALPRTRIGRLTLPGALVSSRTGAGLSTDFNACDTGRLLSVLREIDAYPLSRGLAKDLVAEWDLTEVLVDGHFHSLDDGRLRDRFSSHCTHYTARALRSWGHGALSPYEVAGDESETDRRMRLLHRVGQIGPYGAEPLLLEAVELGLSEPSAFLADVLFGAQHRAHRETGALYCVSEAPLDRAPWFTYQGLDVTSADARWAVSGPTTDPRNRSQAFGRQMLLVNTKAAYLWAAVRPSAFATLLVEHVQRCGNPGLPGFSPGVFAATGQPMAGYTDINTNGVILEAITFILRGHKPRVPLSDQSVQ